MRTYLLLIPALLFPLTSLGCGKAQLKEFSSPEGRFSILMPGKPSQEEKTIGGLRMTCFSTGWRGEENWVAYVDLPPGNPGSLDGCVRGMADASEGSNLKTTTRLVNGEGYAEFEFLANKYGGYVSGQVVIVRRRLYLFFAMGKNAQLSNPEVREFIDSFKLTDGPIPGRQEGGTPSTDDLPPKPSHTDKDKPSRPGPSRTPPASGSTTPSPAASDPDTIVLAPMAVEPNPGTGSASSSFPAPTAPGSTAGATNPPASNPSPLTPAPATPSPGANAFSPMPNRPGRPGGNPNRPQPNPFGQPQMVGFQLGNEYQDTAPEGGLVVGFDVAFNFGINSNNDIIVTVRPVYRVGDKDQFGQMHGTDTKRSTREVAKPGYAVGAITAKGGLCLDGFYITYMKVVGDQLDPNDVYYSPWLGGPGGGEPITLGGDGRTVVGIFGRTNEKDVKAIGLQFGPAPTERLPVGEKPKQQPAPPKIPKAPRFVGGWTDPEFREEAPAGGLLVGFDIGMGGLGGTAIVTIRGIYQLKDKPKDVYGLMHGTNIMKKGRDRAKPGYAVGAITVKGALWVDGFSITYMKVVDDKLDPLDSYESPWFGNPGNPNELFTISGDGTPVVGLIGRQNRIDLNALGLLFKSADPAPAKKDDPAKKPDPAKK